MKLDTYIDRSPEYNQSRDLVTRIFDRHRPEEKRCRQAHAWDATQDGWNMQFRTQVGYTLDPDRDTPVCTLPRKNGEETLFMTEKHQQWYVLKLVNGADGSTLKAIPMDAQNAWNWLLAAWLPMNSRLQDCGEEMTEAIRTILRQIEAEIDNAIADNTAKEYADYLWNS